MDTPQIPSVVAPPDGLASTFEAGHALRMRAEGAADAGLAGSYPFPFPTALAKEQLWKLRRGQAPCSAEQATIKNGKNLERARAFSLKDVAGDATRRIPLDVRGKGCESTRARVACGWVPGEPFATHGGVGANTLCTPTAMREWLLAVPGDLLDVPGDQGARGRSEGCDGAPWATAGVSAGASGEMDFAFTEITTGVAVASLSISQRIEELTPASDSPLPEPTWLRRFAAEAAAGEDFWA